MTNIISNFTGEYSFLSNMYKSEIKCFGYTFTCSEALLQAMKCKNTKDIERFVGIDGEEAKQLSETIELTNDWNEMRVQYMYQVLQMKFKQNKDLMQLLVETGDKTLIDENNLHDNFWGNCTCDKCKDIEGKNNLGKLLEMIRQENNNIITGGNTMTNTNYNYQEMKKFVCENTLAYAILQPKMDLNSIDTSKFPVKVKDRKFEDKISMINFVTCGDKEYLSLKYTNKYLILKKNNDKESDNKLVKAHRNLLDENTYKKAYKEISIDELKDAELIELSKVASEMDFIGLPLDTPMSYKIDVLSDCMKFDTFTGKMVLVTNDNDKDIDKGYIEYKKQVSIFTILTNIIKKEVNTFYGDTFVLNIQPNEMSDDGPTIKECQAFMEYLYKEGFMHIHNNELMVDSEGDVILYRDLTSPASQARKGNSLVGNAKDCDLIRKRIMELGIVDKMNKKEEVNIMQTEARFTLCASTGTPIAKTTTTGQLGYFPEFRIAKIKDSTCTLNTKAVVTKYNSEKDEQIAGATIVDEYTKEIEYTDGSSLCSAKLNAIFGLYLEDISERELKYYLKKITLNSIDKMTNNEELNNHYGANYVVESITKIANENNLEYNGEDIDTIRESNAKLYKAIINDPYYFSYIDADLQNDKLFRKIHHKISGMNIVRQPNEYCKGTLHTHDVEHEKYGAEIVLRESMRKLFKILDPMLESGEFVKMPLPWLVCKKAKHKEQVKIFKQAIMQMKFEDNKQLLNRGKEEIGLMAKSFKDASIAKELLKVSNFAEDGDLEETPDDLKAVKLLNISDELLKTTMIINQMCRRYRYNLYDIALGRLTVNGTVCFILADPFFGTDKELKKGEYYYNGKTCKSTIHRAPANGPLESFLINLVDKEHLWYLENVLVMNCYDSCWIGLGGADFDGDTVFLIWDEWWISQHMQTEHMIVIDTKGKTKALFNEENRRKMLISIVGGGEVGKLTNANMNFYDYIYSEIGPNAFNTDFMLEMMCECASNVGIDIDKAKTGQKSSPREAWLQIVEGTKENPIRLSQHIYYERKAKRNQLKEDFWMKEGYSTGTEYDIREGKKPMVRTSNHPMENLFKFMDNNHYVTLPKDKNNFWELYAEENKLADDNVVVTKLVDTFGANEIARGLEVIATLENSYRKSVVQLMKRKQQMDNDTFKQLREALIEEHSIIFESECINNNINFIIGAACAFISPLIAEDKEKFNYKVSQNYALDICYPHLYEALNYAYNSEVNVDLPLEVLDEAIEVTNGKINIRGMKFKVNVPDGNYVVYDNKFIKHRIALKENTVREKVDGVHSITFKTRDMKQKLHMASHIQGGIASDGKLSPLEAFFAIMKNDYRFTITNHKGNHVLAVGNKVYGVIDNLKGGVFNTALVGKELELVTPCLTSENENVLIEGLFEIFTSNSKSSSARRYDKDILPGVVREIVTIQAKVVGAKETDVECNELNKTYKTSFEMLQEAKKVEEEVTNPDGLDMTNEVDIPVFDQDDCCFDASQFDINYGDFIE